MNLETTTLRLVLPTKYIKQPEPAEAPVVSLFEGQFLYEIFADEIATERPEGYAPIKWRNLSPQAQAVWQATAARFTAAL